MKVYGLLYSLGVCLLIVGTTSPQSGSSLRRRSGTDSRVMTSAEKEAYAQRRAAGSEQRREQIGFNADSTSQAFYDSFEQNPTLWVRQFVTIYEMPDWEKQYTAQQVDEFVDKIVSILNGPTRIPIDDFEKGLNDLDIPERLKNSLISMFEPIINKVKAEQKEKEQEEAAAAAAAENLGYVPLEETLGQTARQEQVRALNIPLLQEVAAQQPPQTMTNEDAENKEWYDRLLVSLNTKTQKLNIKIQNLKQIADVLLKEQYNKEIEDLKKEIKEIKGTIQNKPELWAIANKLQNITFEQEQQQAQPQTQAAKEEEEEALLDLFASSPQTTPTSMTTTDAERATNENHYDELLRKINLSIDLIAINQDRLKNNPSDSDANKYKADIEQDNILIETIKKEIADTPALKEIRDARAQQNVE